MEITFGKVAIAMATIAIVATWIDGKWVPLILVFIEISTCFFSKHLLEKVCCFFADKIRNNKWRILWIPIGLLLALQRYDESQFNRVFNQVVLYFCNTQHIWPALSAFSSIVILLSLPQIQNWLNKPQIKLSLCRPDPHNKKNDSQYWHIKIKNTGGTVEKANLCLVALKYKNEKGEREQFIPAIPFLWPWRGIRASCPRSIVREQYVDFFFYNPGGEGELVLYPIPNNVLDSLPKEPNDFLEIAIKLIGEKYEDPEKTWFRITRHEKGNEEWSIEPVRLSSKKSTDDLE